MSHDPKASLDRLVDSGWFDDNLPEISDLDMEQDPKLPVHHLHKNVLLHTIKVVSQTPTRLTVRLAALFHDVGKPATRAYDSSGVTFQMHESVGSYMALECMTRLGFAHELCEDVAAIVRLSGRLKDYSREWTDAAVRRYAHDAGHLLGDLNDLIRSDCTSRHQHIHDAINRNVDDMERRIRELAARDAAAARRAFLDGNDIMVLMGIGPGPQIGRAIEHLMSLEASGAVATKDQATEAVLQYFSDRNGA